MLQTKIGSSQNSGGLYRHFFGVMFWGRAVNGLKVPKWSQTKVLEKKGKCFGTPEIPPQQKYEIIASLIQKFNTHVYMFG